MYVIGAFPVASAIRRSSSTTSAAAVSSPATRWASGDEVQRETQVHERARVAGDLRLREWPGRARTRRPTARRRPWRWVWTRRARASGRPRRWRRPVRGPARVRGSASARPPRSRPSSGSPGRRAGRRPPAAGRGRAARPARPRRPRAAEPFRSARPHRGHERLEVRLARQVGVERLEASGRAEQQPSGVAAALLLQRDLPAQVLHLGGLQRRRAALPRPRPAGPVRRRARRRRASPWPPRAGAAHGEPGSGVSIAARSRNAAAAAMPPRACARPAERSSSEATSSSGPGAAWARCQARRSGSTSGSVTSASARCTSCRSWTDADR